MIKEYDIKPVKDREAREPYHCLYCGRFAHIINNGVRYNGEFNIRYIIVKCHSCGTYQEDLD